MGSPYPNDVRERARDLWLAGGMSDPQIATAVGVDRPDTIRNWRKAEDWESFRVVVDRSVKERIAKDERVAVREMNKRHDKLGEAIRNEKLTEEPLIEEVSRSLGYERRRVERGRHAQIGKHNVPPQQLN